MDWYLTQKGEQAELPKQAYQHLLAACRDLKWSQSMVKLHPVKSIYNIETMLGSLFVFYNGNTYNGLIFDPNGCSEPPLGWHSRGRARYMKRANNESWSTTKQAYHKLGCVQPQKGVQDMKQSREDRTRLNPRLPRLRSSLHTMAHSQMWCRE